mgnify:FL=1
MFLVLIEVKKLIIELHPTLINTEGCLHLEKGNPDL